MKYEINQTLFIREEIEEGDRIYFVFVGDKNKMYKLNESAYDCYKLLEENVSPEEMLNRLQKKYDKTDIESIRKFLCQTIEYLVEIGIVAEV